MKRIVASIIAGVLIIGAVIILLLRDRKTEDFQVDNQMPVHKVKVEEVIQTTSYTYMKVKEKKLRYWIAVVRQEAAPGESYSYSTAYEMTNFKSNELDRTFQTIFFVQDLSDGSGGSVGAMNPMGSMMQPQKPRIALNEEISVDPAAGGISIGDLFRNRSDYSSKKVRIRGQVVKVVPEVMNKNWVHIQDGTSDSGNFDLTVTTREVLVAGDVVTFEGTISLDKDFGAGYIYAVILEDAAVIEKKAAGQ